LLERSLLILVRLAIAILAGLGLYLFFRYFWPLVAMLIDTSIKVLLPLLISYLVALILHPSINHLERSLHINRTWGAALALIVFLGIIGGLLFLLASNLIRELLQLYQQLSFVSQGLGSWNINMVTEKLRLFLTQLQLPPDIIQNALQNYQQIFNFLRNIVNFLLVEMYFLVMSLPHYFFMLIVTVIASYFFARDYHLLKNGLLRALPDQWKAPVRRVASGLHRALQGYVKVELLMVFLTGLESLIGLSILGVSYAHILAIVVIILDFLPVLGIAILYVPWAIWLLFAGNLRLGIGLLILYGIIVLVRQLIEPRILARNMGLHPLTTLIAIYMGLMLLGFWGLLLGPAVVIAYKAFFDESPVIPPNGAGQG
jgi:sporulation integral membrane protein YtvI